MKRESQSKNKMIYIALSVIFIVTIVVFGVMKIRNYIIEKKEQEKIDRTVFQRQILEKDDGWYYFLDINRTEPEIGQYQYYYSFSGCNLKYETLDYSYTIVDDLQTGEILQTTPSTPPALATCRISKNGENGKTVAEETAQINKFLERKQFHEKLTLEDFSEMKFVNFDSNDIVTLWNQFDEKNYFHYKDFGPYSNLAVCNYKKNDSEQNYFQVGVMMGYGLIREVRIDYINETKEYLTDKIESQTASKEEQQLYENIQNMEKTIIEKQSFAIEDSYPDLKTNSFYTPLFDLLNQYEVKK